MADLRGSISASNWIFKMETRREGRERGEEVRRGGEEEREGKGSAGRDERQRWER